MMHIADPYFDTTDPGQAQIWPLPPFASLERRIAVAMVVFLVLINQAQVGITVRLSFFNRDWFNAIQNKDASCVLATAAARLHALGLRLRREHGDRVRRAIDAGDPLAALAHRVLRRPLARRPYPLPHEPHRQRGGQSGPAHRRRRQPLHRRRRENPGARHLFLLDPADLDAVVAGVVRGRAVGALGQLHHSGDRAARPRLPVLDRARLCGGGHVDHPCDRALAGRALLRAPAHGGRFPLLAGAASRIHRAGRAAQWRGARSRRRSAGGSAASSGTISRW